MATDKPPERLHPGHTVPLRTGTRLRQYVVQEVIGAGGFGITYRAEHERLAQKSYAIKEYFPRGLAIRDGTVVHAIAADQTMFGFGLQRFLQEAKILALCQHPAIVDVVDYFEANGTAYAVLALVDGMQMGDWLKALGRPPAQAELDRLLVPLLDALAVVHGHKLLHRDIAPDNILVKPDGTSCLIDFGAARADLGGANQTTAAFVKGSFSPPEQYLGRADRQGPWTDIYALGATLYRAVTGVTPPETIARGQLSSDMPPVAAIMLVDYRPGFLAAIDRALQLQPERRPQSIDAWRDELMRDESVPQTARPVVPDLPTPVASAAGNQPPPPQAAAAPPRTAAAVARASSASMTAVAAVLVMCAGLGWWWLAARSPSPAVPTASAVLPRAPSPAVAPHTVEPPPSAASAAPAGPVRSEAAEAIRPQSPHLAATWDRCLATDTEPKIIACRELAATPGLVSADAARAYFNLGLGLRANGDADAAITAYENALRFAPEMTDAHNQKGIALFDKGLHDHAIAAYTEAIRSDPTLGEVFNNRAWTYFRSGRAARGLVDADRAVALLVGRAYVWDTRGHILEQLGRRDEAIRDFRQALALDAASAESRAGLKRLGIDE